MDVKGLPPLQRLCLQLREGRNGCWLWSGAHGGIGKATGYGAFVLNGKSMGAHRAAWELFMGAVPAGMCVLHECDNRRCCHPFHLYIGTKKDNRADFMARHPRAIEMVEESHANALKALRNWWRGMTPKEREAFCKRRAAVQAQKRKARL